MKVGIRVDGGFQIGLGHVYRSLWLSETLRRKGDEIVFLITSDLATEALIREKNFPLKIFPKDWDEEQKLKAVNEWVWKCKPSIFIIDHWDWPSAFWNFLEKVPDTLYVAMDVPAEGFHKFDLAFQGIRNELANLEYSADECKVFEGPKYLMLSPDFQPYINLWKSTLRLKNILLTFGGSDVANFSIKILDFFENYPLNFNLTLVLGPAVKIFNLVKKRLEKSRLNVKILRDVSCLPMHMIYSDLVISTSGAGTLADMALTGTPGVVFAAVEHQIDNAEKFSMRGGVLNCAKKVGVIDNEFYHYIDALVANPEKLNELSQRWKGLVDGKGIERILQILKRAFHEQ